jgi:hypothetical protein
MSAPLPEYLDRLAQLQHGVLSATQARRGGLSLDSVKSRLRSGKWQQLHHGVYATFTGEPRRDALLWAAVLRAGPGALLSHYTAAELFGLVDMPTSPIHLTVPQARRVLPIRGVTVHVGRRGAMPGHSTAMPPRTRIEETVLDLTQAAVNVDDACGWITRGIGRRLTTQQRLCDALGQRPHVHFRADLRELLSPDFAGVHSPLEYRYVKWVEMPHGLPRGRRQAPGKRDGRNIYRDVLYDGYNLIVELDGRAAHPGDGRWKDIRRDNAAIASGLMTLRYGSGDLSARPCAVADEVYHVLRRAGPVSAYPCSPACPVARNP